MLCDNALHSATRSEFCGCVIVYFCAWDVLNSLVSFLPAKHRKWMIFGTIVQQQSETWHWVSWFFRDALRPGPLPSSPGYRLCCWLGGVSVLWGRRCCVLCSDLITHDNMVFQQEQVPSSPVFSPIQLPIMPGNNALSPDSALAADIFDHYCAAQTFKGILSHYRRLCATLNLKPGKFPVFYPKLKVSCGSLTFVSFDYCFFSHRCNFYKEVCCNIVALLLRCIVCITRHWCECYLFVLALRLSTDLINTFSTGGI